MTPNFNDFKTLDLKQIAKEGPPPIDFIWDGFPAGSVGALVSLSPGGVGKSYFALEAAVAVAGGYDLLALNPQRTGRVVYLDALDGEDVLTYRLHFIGKYLSQEQWVTVASNLIVESVYGSMFDIMREDHLKKIIRLGAGSRLIILDSISSMHCLNEDKRPDAERLLDRLEYIMEQTGATILFLKNVYGGSALVDKARWRGFLRIMTKTESMELSDYFFSSQAIGEERRHLYVHYVSFSFRDYDVVASSSRFLVRDRNGVLRPANLRSVKKNGEVR